MHPDILTVLFKKRIFQDTQSEEYPPNHELIQEIKNIKDYGITQR